MIPVTPTCSKVSTLRNSCRAMVTISMPPISTSLMVLKPAWGRDELAQVEGSSSQVTHLHSYPDPTHSRESIYSLLLGFLKDTTAFSKVQPPFLAYDYRTSKPNRCCLPLLSTYFLSRTNGVSESSSFVSLDTLCLCLILNNRNNPWEIHREKGRHHLVISPDCGTFTARFQCSYASL